MWMWPFSWVEQLSSWERIANWGVFLELSLVSEGAWCLQGILMCVLSCVQLFATPWTATRQARQEYWSGLACPPPPPPGDRPNPGIELGSPHCRLNLVSKLDFIETSGKAISSFRMLEWVLEVVFLFEQMFCYFVIKVRRFEQCCPESYFYLSKVTLSSVMLFYLWFRNQLLIFFSITALETWWARRSERLWVKRTLPERLWSPSPTTLAQ